MWKWILIFWAHCSLLKNREVLAEPSKIEKEVGEPLILTRFLEENKVDEAQELARVKPDIGNTTSYSGYFTVNKDCESNLFFWFFPAENNWEEAPLVLWVQGGPGASSLQSLFDDLGPLTYEDELGRREHAWNLDNNLLFVDQPAGTGFSFTNKGCYAKNQTVVGKEFYSAVIQFLQLFPVLAKNKFYLAGHSYAGHFIPSLGHTIHLNNPTATVKINLCGIMIGNGWMDIYYQSDFGSFLYQVGLIDEVGRSEYYETQEQLSDQIKENDYENAMKTLGQILEGLHKKHVGNVSIYNYVDDSFSLVRPYENFVQMPQTRKAIHVGNEYFSFLNATVIDTLGVDYVVSMKTWVEELLEHYPIVFYSGHLDIISGYPMMVNFLRSLEWSGAEEYKNASRQRWCVDGQQAGYLKNSSGLYEVMVRKAGHFVARDQPLWAYALLQSVTTGPSNDPFHALDIC